MRNGGGREPFRHCLFEHEVRLYAHKRRLLGINAVTLCVSACIASRIMASVSVTTSIAPPNLCTQRGVFSMKKTKYLLPVAAAGVLALTLSACSGDGGGGGIHRRIG